MRPNRFQRLLQLPATVLIVFTSISVAQQPPTTPPNGQGWPTYGGDAGGSRYSSSTQITPTNLARLRPAWTFHTHTFDRSRPANVDASFESTPILFGSALFFTSPFDVVFSIDATTGNSRWTYDPAIAPLEEGNIVTSRGVALWSASAALRPRLSTCKDRAFLGTIDGRLIALDAETGKPCTDFGSAGQVDLKLNVHFRKNYGVTSPPTVIGNTVIVGSIISDNQRVDPESGIVRAYDVVTGAFLWSWEPIPWAAQQKVRTGGANTWSVIAADPSLGLVYLPTGSAAPDYYGGMRPGDDRDADSIVALDARTGKKVWAFQVVHHDLWDYDVAAEPLLFTFRNSIPAVAIATKMGLVFVLDRRTGAPLYPIHERPVPQTDVPGETSSATQPFPDTEPLSSTNLAGTALGQTWHRSTANEDFCQSQLATLRNDGIYTPPSLHGSVMFPGNLGGVNWGSAAIDPATGMLYANSNRIPFQARLIPRYGAENRHRIAEIEFFDWANWGIAAGIVLAIGVILAWLRRRTLRPGPRTILLTAALMLTAVPIALHYNPADRKNLSHFGYELSEQHGSPYLVQRDVLVDHDHHPCSAPPWGVISALNLNTGKNVWQRPLGSAIPGQNTGVANFGGPIVTATGIVFTAAAEDPYIRGFDAATGAELWTYELPTPAQATPMTYTLAGHQYLVIAAGGHGDKATKLGDSLIAFALDYPPQP